MFIELMLCIFVEMVVIFHFKITHIVCIKSLPRIIEKLLTPELIQLALGILQVPRLARILKKIPIYHAF